MMKISLLFSLLLLLHTTTTTHALDITQTLNQYPDFSNFNSYLTQTGLSVIINGRTPPLTILVVDNANAAPLASKPMNVLKNILSVHVILDYYDLPKLQTISTTTGLPTTLFQSTGDALGQQGFLNITRVGGGSIAFSSAMPGSSGPSNYVKSVHAEPYSLSILQISSPIIPQGIDGAKTSSPPSTTPGATPPPPSIATPPTPSSTVTPSTTTPPTPSTVTPPSTTTPPTPSTMTLPSTTTPPPAAAQVSTPPQASTMAPPTPGAAAIPSMAPPTAAKGAPIPSTTAPPKASAAPIPSTISPTSSNAAPLPSSISPTTATPSSTPAAAPGSASAPGAAAPTSEEPGETTPAEGAPKAKSAGKSLDAGLALAFTMVLSTFYLASSMI